MTLPGPRGNFLQQLPAVPQRAGEVIRPLPHVALERHRHPPVAVQVAVPLAELRVGEVAETPLVDLPMPACVLLVAGQGVGDAQIAARSRQRAMSPRDLVAFEDAIKHKTVKVLLYNAQVTDAQTTQIKQLAADSGVPIVGVTETMPPAYQHLQDWQLAQARDLLAALQKSGR